jgi:hypothetical protein
MTRTALILLLHPPSSQLRRLLSAVPFTLEIRVPGSTVLSAVSISRRMMGIRVDRPSNVDIAVCEQPQPKTRNDHAHVPAGTSRFIRRTDAKGWQISVWRDLQVAAATASGWCADRRVEGASVPPHRVHDHCELACHRYRGTTKADFLP